MRSATMLQLMLLLTVVTLIVDYMFNLGIVAFLGDFLVVFIVLGIIVGIVGVKIK